MCKRKLLTIDIRQVGRGYQEYDKHWYQMLRYSGYVKQHFKNEEMMK
jgi:hypothetical protein